MATNLTGDAISLGGLYGINRFNALRHKKYKLYPRSTSQLTTEGDVIQAFP